MVACITKPNDNFSLKYLFSLKQFDYRHSKIKVSSVVFVIIELHLLPFTKNGMFVKQILHNVICHCIYIEPHVKASIFTSVQW